jgi:hypothetical protein
MVLITPSERNTIINNAFNYLGTNPKTTITASGSSVALTFNSKIGVKYKSSTYNYTTTGNASGISNINNNVHSFAFSDGNYVVSLGNTPSNIITLPVGLDALAFVYNIDFVANFTAKAGDFTLIDNKWQYTQGNGTNTGNDVENTGVDKQCNDKLRTHPLKITPEIIVGIYKGVITTWDSADIKNINDIEIAITIPVTSTETGTGYISIFSLLVRDNNNESIIKPLHRSGSSNANSALTTYLLQNVQNSGITSSTTMTTAFGGALTGQGFSLASGVLDNLNANKNTFAYIMNIDFLNQQDYDPTNTSQSSSYKLPPARLKNPAGKFVTLNSSSVTKQFLAQSPTTNYYKANSIAFNSINYTITVSSGYPLISIVSIFFRPALSQITSKKFDVVCFLIYLTQQAKFARITATQTTGNILADGLGQDQANSSNMYSFPSFIAQRILETILNEFSDVKATLLST